MTLTLPFILHTVTGLVAFGAAVLALAPRKGGSLHRRAGKVFVAAMLLMAGSGALIALSMQAVLSVIGGMLTIYLVLTGWLTVARAGRPPGPAEAICLLAALFIGTLAWVSGLEAANSETGLSKHGFHPVQYYMFAVLALLAAAGDVRFFVTRFLNRSQRIARHLWRMCMGLMIAAAAFFLGQARLFPEAIRESGLLSIPVLLVLLVMLFWLARVLWTSWPAPMFRPLAARKAP